MTKFRKQKFKKETSLKLFKVANDDLYAAEVLFSAPKYRAETVLYHVQQAIEKSLKAVLISYELAVPLTHDLDVLTSELPQEIVGSLPTNIGELTQYATIRRYLDGEELLESQDIIAALSVGRQVLVWAQSVLSA